MIKDIWINLPVKNVSKAREFYTALGFTPNTHYGDGEGSASFFVGKQKVVLMLFSETAFKRFTRTEMADTKLGTEVLFSIGAESRADVDEMARLTLKAGGTVFGKPEEIQGWMYGCGFADLDGHRWNMLHMDASQMPKG
jgi:predicted lactoylglutathione lyase